MDIPAAGEREDVISPAPVPETGANFGAAVSAEKAAELIAVETIINEHTLMAWRCDRRIVLNPQKFLDIRSMRVYFNTGWGQLNCDVGICSKKQPDQPLGRSGCFLSIIYKTESKSISYRHHLAERLWLSLF
jgi:hypothetical protein